MAIDTIDKDIRNRRLIYIDESIVIFSKHHATNIDFCPLIFICSGISSSTRVQRIWRGGFRLQAFPIF